MMRRKKLMNCKYVFIGLWVVLLVTLGQSAYTQDDKQVSAAMRDIENSHPRLIAKDNDLERIREYIKKDDIARMVYNDLRRQMIDLMKQPTVEYKIVGPRLLTQSRNCLDRIYKLGLLYRLDGEKQYIERAKQELFAAAAFPDWNPSHFLDTAEMSHAFAIGYDWLYDDLTENERNIIRTALIEKGLKPYLEAWEKDTGWTRSTHNWNQVCNGGCGIGALAIADEEPELAQKVLSTAVNGLPKALAGYAPDGGWNEGPGYWHYATRYTVYFLAALDTALGTDFGLSNAPGLDQAGTFRIHFESPIGETFNYADAGSRVGSTHEMFWLARRYDKPVYAWHQREHLGSPHALDLIWFSDAGSAEDLKAIPKNAHYKGIDVVFLRGEWNDHNALFVGFKGGDNKANHSHLDLGSFVLDRNRVRWAVDLGPDNYNLPGYFDTRNRRWSYFRNNTHSHNTLVINGENQDPRAAAPILRFEDGESAFAISDLTAAYANAVSRMHRGIRMMDAGHVLIQDEVEAAEPVAIQWNMLTEAEIEIQGQKAILRQDGKEMQLVVLSPENARIRIESASPAEPERQNPGVKKITVTFPEKLIRIDMAVLMAAGETGETFIAPSRSITPLSQWRVE